MQQLRILIPVVFILIPVMLLSCVNTVFFEKDYYERVTKIRLPDQCKILQTFDNGEYLAGTVFRFDDATLHTFIIRNKFDSVKPSNYIHLLSNAYFDKEYRLPYPDENYKLITPKNARLYVRQGSSSKVNWIYLADMTTNRLWTEISYPDRGGH